MSVPFHRLSPIPVRCLPDKTGNNRLFVQSNGGSWENYYSGCLYFYVSAVNDADVSMELFFDFDATFEDRYFGSSPPEVGDTDEGGTPASLTATAFVPAWGTGGSSVFEFGKPAPYPNGGPANGAIKLPRSVAEGLGTAFGIQVDLQSISSTAYATTNKLLLRFLDATGLYHSDIDLSSAVVVGTGSGATTVGVATSVVSAAAVATAVAALGAVPAYITMVMNYASAPTISYLHGILSLAAGSSSEERPWMESPTCEVKESKTPLPCTTDDALSTDVVIVEPAAARAGQSQQCSLPQELALPALRRRPF